MTSQQVEEKVRRFLGPDLTDAPVSQPDLYQIMNECYLEYWARFAWVWSMSAVVSSGQPAFQMGGGDTGQWADCEGLYVWDRSTTDPDTGLPVYHPLKRYSEGQILSATRSVGGVGRPENYSLSLRTRSLTTATSVFNVRVYPVPDQLYDYRARVRLWPVGIENIGDPLLSMDDLQGEQVVLWLALRIAYLRGYPMDLVRRLAAMLPPRIAVEIDIHDTRDWPSGVPRRVGELEDEVA